MIDWKPKQLAGQFIDDIDPYEGKQSIPTPVAVEVNSDEAWNDFLAATDAFETQVRNSSFGSFS